MRLPDIPVPKPNATHPRLPGAWTVARISELSAEEDEVTGSEKATQTPELESHACVLAALTILTTHNQVHFNKGNTQY